MTTSGLVGTDWIGPRTLSRMLIMRLKVMHLIMRLRRVADIRRMERISGCDPLPPSRRLRRAGSATSGLSVLAMPSRRRACRRWLGARGVSRARERPLLRRALLDGQRLAVMEPLWRVTGKQLVLGLVLAHLDP